MELMQTLDAETFAQAAATWLTFVSTNSLSTWSKLFGFSNGPNEPFQAYVSFDITNTILPLLSTPCLKRVLARFILVKPSNISCPSSTYELAFQVVLYGVDKKGIRLTPYYMGYTDFSDGAAPLSGIGSALQDAPSQQIPHKLAQFWIDNWANNDAINGLQFNTVNGPLQGYDFPLDDFMNTLFFATSGEVDNHELRLTFSLKEYYPPQNDPQIQQLFGLLVRIVATPNPEDNYKDGSKVNSLGVVMSNSSAFDMSNPNPPGL